MTPHRPDLSVVLPCYRAASLARRSVSELATVFEDFGMAWEVVVDDDGGNDFDGAVFPECVRLLRHRVNRGKGAAVRTGMRAATGHVRVFKDIDLPFGTHLLPIIHSYLRAGVFHVQLLRNETSSVRLLRDATRCAIDVWRIKADFETARAASARTAIAAAKP